MRSGVEVGKFQRPGWRSVGALCLRGTHAAAPAAKPHLIVIQVDQNDPAVMNLALNNATNVIEYYRAKGQDVQIDLVTFGPGLHMLHDDSSPVIPQDSPVLGVTNTKENMETGMELQEKGWSYIRP